MAPCQRAPSATVLVPFGTSNLMVAPGFFFVEGVDTQIEPLVMAKPISRHTSDELPTILFLRLSGQRTLSKMNAFDFVVTIALGSTLATVLLRKDVSLAQGVAAFLLLICLQFVVTWLSVRARWVRRLVTGEPQMLLYDGQFIAGAMRDARVTEDEIKASVRAAGFEDLADVRAVILETDASFSVINTRASIRVQASSVREAALSTIALARAGALCSGHLLG